MSGGRHRATVDAVVACLRPFASHSSGLAGSLSLPPDTDWPRLVALASSHLVLPALAGPLLAHAESGAVPSEATAFLATIAQSNAARNRDLCAVLFDIADQFNAIDVTPLVLKGGAFLLDSANDAAPWRFMSDIDLLVHPGDLERCVVVMTASGYVPVTSQYDPTREAHYPPLVSPCQRFTVELHTRLFGHGDFGLAVADVLGDAVPAPAGRSDILVPAPHHRLMHVLAHAQLHNRNWMARRIVLKDLLDISVLNRLFGPMDWNDIAARFSSHSDRERCMALVQAWQTITACGPGLYCCDPHQKSWANLARAGLYRSGITARLGALSDMVRIEAHRMREDEGHLGHRFRQLCQPRLLAPALSSYRYKLRQRLWS